MRESQLNLAASRFRSESETLHDRFLAIDLDQKCQGCHSAGFGQAILTTWLQEYWIAFNRTLITLSAVGTRRQGNPVKALPGVRSTLDAERVLKPVVAHVLNKRRLNAPVWHATWFVIEISDQLGLSNHINILSALGSTAIPQQVSDFRNYLVHPNAKTRQKYQDLQAKLGMLNIEPEHLLVQSQSSGLPLFTWWVRELQRIADAATQ